MKKYFPLLFAMLVITAVQAQKGFHIGVSGTFNSTWVLNQNNYGTLAPFTNPVIRTSEMDYKTTWGGNAGIVLGYNFTRNWGLQAELQYNVTGQKYKDAFEGPAILPEGTFGSSSEYVPVERDIRLSYIQIPIMARFTSNKAHVAKFFACLGPQFGIRLTASEKVKVAGFDYNSSSVATYTTKDKFKTFDAGLALQFGTDLYCTSNLYVEIGFSAYGGLSDINGKALKNLGWYSQNDVEYQKSYNFRAGLMVGVHYIIGEGSVDY